MTEAIEQYTQALQRAKRSPETSPKERARIYQKLTQASMKSSILAPKPKKQTAHAKAAYEYAQAALQAAKDSGDDCMAAQVEFLLACVALWMLRLQSEGERAEEAVSKGKDELQICLERLKRYPEVRTRVYEEQMRVYLGYFAETS
jgi:hypothetical protein